MMRILAKILSVVAYATTWLPYPMLVLVRRSQTVYGSRLTWKC